MMRVTGATSVYALLGHPVRHSGSPAMHNRWFAVHGIDGVYVALPVLPSEAHGLVPAVRTLGLAGANLTVPYKASVAGALDGLSGLASVGVVNTVVREEGGRLIGHNTDGEGFLDGLVSLGMAEVSGLRALVLGAGGAGRAIAAALVRHGASVVLLNRRRDRAEEAADRIRAWWPPARVVVGELAPAVFAAHAPAADLVVHATAGGGASVVDGFEVQALPPHAAWVEINYWMDAPPARDTLRALGLKYQGGHAMLRHQAARAFRLWTGVLPEALPRPEPLG